MFSIISAIHAALAAGPPSEELLDMLWINLIEAGHMPDEDQWSMASRDDRLGLIQDGLAGRRLAVLHDQSRHWPL